jgi:SAM-dependent methyltransferase
MSRDVLLYGLSQSEEMAYLLQWMQTTPGLHDFVPDAHRLQLEHWIWSKRAELGTRILDVGVYNPRRWLGDGYITFGEHGEDTHGDLLRLPFANAAFDGVVLTEVLEHCTDPKWAIGEVHRVLKPGGLLLVTSPFIWSWHGVEGEYQDYWRFTHQGWKFLLAAFTDVSITPCAWTDEGAAAYDTMRRFECFGFANQVTATTGYLCSARRPGGNGPLSGHENSPSASDGSNGDDR